GIDDRNEKAGPILVQRTQGSNERTSGSKEGSKEKIGQVRKVPRPSSLPNKPWEPNFKLKLNPPDYIKMKWVRGVSVYSEMTITNNLPFPQCYKMKCTDNSQFRVRPPMNFLDKGASASVKSIHHSYVLPEHNKHYFAIYHVKCTPEEMRARNFKRIWRRETQPDGVIRVPVAFEMGDVKISNSMKASGMPSSSTMTTITAGPISGPSRPGAKAPVGGRPRSNKKK
ncbi:hypothetical protein PENTCL1PPCAC_19768, partial [Pristionchus entomophagus]